MINLPQGRIAPSGTGPPRWFKERANVNCTILALAVALMGSALACSYSPTPEESFGGVALQQRALRISEFECADVARLSIGEVSNKSHGGLEVEDVTLVYEIERSEDELVCKGLFRFWDQGAWRRGEATGGWVMEATQLALISDGIITWSPMELSHYECRYLAPVIGNRHASDSDFSEAIRGAAGPAEAELTSDTFRCWYDVVSRSERVGTIEVYIQADEDGGFSMGYDRSGDPLPTPTPDPEEWIGDPLITRTPYPGSTP